MGIYDRLSNSHSPGSFWMQNVKLVIHIHVAMPLE